MIEGGRWEVVYIGMRMSELTSGRFGSTIDWSEIWCGSEDTCFGRMNVTYDLRGCGWVLWEVVRSCTGES